MTATPQVITVLYTQIASPQGALGRLPGLPESKPSRESLAHDRALCKYVASQTWILTQQAVGVRDIAITGGAQAAEWVVGPKAFEFVARLIGLPGKYLCDQFQIVLDVRMND